MSNLVILDDSQSGLGQDIEKDEIEIEAGQYWLCKEPIDGIKKETLLLIQSLNIIDNILHSVELAPHPLSSRSKPYRIMTDDFLESFEFIPLHVAEQMRAKEIESVNDELNELREELMIGYVDETGNSASLLLQGASSQKENGNNLPVSASRDVDKIKESAKSLAEVAKKQADFIKGKNELIVKATEKLACLYKEKGTQALASVDGTMKFVQKLHSGIQTLDIYIGKGVYVHQFAEGEPASSDEPLTIYQRKLYFDEEVFANYADGGSDINSVKSFAEYVEKDNGLLNRLIPAQRGVILMQVRRHDKQYFSSDELLDIGSRMYQNQMNEANKECFLLLRNGGNVYLIESDFLKGGERLFPTAKEISQIYAKSDTQNYGKKFEGIDEKIKPSELKYVDSRKKHDDKTAYYKRILVLLSGLYERDTDVVGEFKQSSKYIGAWYNLDFQKNCCKFIYDDEDALDFNSQRFNEFIVEKNEYLRSGSRIIYLPRKLINSESAPIMFQHEHRWNNYSRVRPDEKQAIVKKHQKEYIIEFKVSKEVWNRNEGSKDSIRNCKVTLSKADGGSFLVLDAVKSSELKAFIDSRKERQHYLEYMELFLEAYKFLKIEEDEIQPFVDDLKKHIQVDDSVDLNSVIEEAIRIYRADNEGEMLPIPHKDNERYYFENQELRENYLETLERIGQIVYSVLEEDKVLSRIKSAVSKMDVVRMVVDAKGKYFVYADVNKEKQYKFLQDEQFPYPMIYKYPVKVLKTKVNIEEPSLVYDKKVSIEKTLFENRIPYSANEFSYRAKNSRDYSVCVSATKVGEYALDEINMFKKSFESSRKILSEAFSKEGLSVESIDALLDRHIKNNKNRSYSQRTVAIFPLALYGFDKKDEVDKSDGYAYPSKALGIAYLSVNVAKFVGIRSFGENREYAYSILSNHYLGGTLGSIENDCATNDKPERSYMDFIVKEIHLDKPLKECKLDRESSILFGYIDSDRWGYSIGFDINTHESKVEASSYKEAFDQFIEKKDQRNNHIDIETIFISEDMEKYYDLLRDDKIKKYCPNYHKLIIEWYNELKSTDRKKEYLYTFFKESCGGRAGIRKTINDEEVAVEITSVEKEDGNYIIKYDKRVEPDYFPEEINWFRSY